MMSRTIANLESKGAPSKRYRTRLVVSLHRSLQFLYMFLENEERNGCMVIRGSGDG